MTRKRKYQKILILFLAFAVAFSGVSFFTPESINAYAQSNYVTSICYASGTPLEYIESEKCYEFVSLPPASQENSLIVSLNLTFPNEQGRYYQFYKGKTKETATAKVTGSAFTRHSGKASGSVKPKLMGINLGMQLGDVYWLKLVIAECSSVQEIATADKKE